MPSKTIQAPRMGMERTGMATLILHTSDGPKTFEVSGVMTMGRQTDNAIRLKEGKASRYHSRVLKSGNDYLIEDLGSSNGTKVNGKKIKRCVLRHGDTIQIGKTRLQFEDKEAKSRPIAVRTVHKDTLVGSKLDNYKIISKLGQGGMGAVYKAEQLSMERMVALKVLKKDLSKNSKFVKGFLQEARVAGKLTHPGLVQVHDFGESDGTLYFSMEYIEGETVNQKLKKEGKLSTLDALKVAIEVGEALEYASKKKIVHQDVKPHNIMIDKFNNVKLADLGLAAIVGPNQPKGRKSGPIMGTPHYMPPEQSQKEEVDCRTDIYALGATLFQMVTGKVPFDGPNSLVILTKHITEKRPDPREFNVTIPDELADLILQMMAVEKEKRPTNPGEVVYRLKAIQKRELQTLEEKKEKRKLGSGVIKKRATLSVPDFSNARPGLMGAKASSPPVPVRGAQSKSERAEGKAVAVSSSSAPQGTRNLAPVKKAPPVQSIVNFGLLAVFLFGGYYMLKGIFNAAVTPATTRPRVKRKYSDPEPKVSKVKDSGSKVPVIDRKKSGTKVLDSNPTATLPQPKTDGPDGGEVKKPFDPEAVATFQKVLDARDRALQSGNFAGARKVLKEFQRNNDNDEIGQKAITELKDTERLIQEAMGLMFEGAKKAADKRAYRNAVARCTRLISADPNGTFARNARAMMNQIDSITEPRFKQTMEKAKEQFSRARLDEAIQLVGGGLSDLGGTKWAGALSTYQFKLILASTFLRSCEAKRKAIATGGKTIPVQAKDLSGARATGVLQSIKGLIFKATLKNVTLPYKLSELSTNEIYEFVSKLGMEKDHLGLGNLLMLLGRTEQAQKEIEQALTVPEQAEEASKMVANLKGVSKIQIYDFSRWQHQGDWEAPEGAWATKNDQYVLESSEGGDTRLRPDALGGPLAFSNSKISFDFKLKNPQPGYYFEAILGEEQKNISIVFSSEGFKLEARCGGSATEAGAWKPGSRASRVDLKFKGNTVTLSLNGKEIQQLSANGVSGLRGTIAFHVREAACTFDNIIIRKGK